MSSWLEGKQQTEGSYVVRSIHVTSVKDLVSNRSLYKQTMFTFLETLFCLMIYET